MYRIALCDDVKYQVGLVYDNLEDIADELSLEIEVETYNSGESIIRSYCRGERYDIVFLDIQMKDMDGLETAERIRALDKSVLIIFLTGYTDFLEKGYEVQAFRYLIKPVNLEKLRRAFVPAISQIQVNKRGAYIVSSKGEEIRLMLDDIYYFESRDHMVYIYEESGEIQIRARLKDIEEDLSNKGFVRCHKGYLVNVHRIRRFGNKDLVLDNESIIPVSRGCAKKSKEAFMLTMR